MVLLITNLHENSTDTIEIGVMFEWIQVTTADREPCPMWSR